MKNRFFLREIFLCSGLLGICMSPAYADPACDAEVVAIQAALDTPAAGTSAANLEQAEILSEILSGNCASGSTLVDAAPVSQQIRSLLGMGEG